MARETTIEYPDSTLNLEMGCDGCELWIPANGVFSCYAGTMTKKYAGSKGWPEQFEKPVIFPERLEEALAWPDLTGTDRPGKPWLNGLPRIIFLNDMGDTFTPSLPKNWLAPFLPRMAESPHQFLILTKQAAAMAAFAREFPLPPNCWPGVSVTSSGKLSRVDHLVEIKSGGPKWVSYEPALERIDWGLILGIDVDWVVAGGLSGKLRATPIESLFDAMTEGRANFIKQLGSLVTEPYHEISEARRKYLMKRKHSILYPAHPRGFLEFKGSGDPPAGARIQWEPVGKGGNRDEWPEALRVRQMPQFNFAPRKPEPKPEPVQTKPGEVQRSLF